MMIDVLALAEQDTQLHRESVREQAGPCPDTSCRCQTNGFRVKWNGEKWVYMCRGCWDAEEYLSTKDRKRGWGDEIDYLRHYRRMHFKQAKAYLAEQGNDLDQAPRRAPVLGLNYLSDHWQEQTRDAMREHRNHLWDPDDTTGLDYARGRGLNDETIRKAALGYSLVEAIPRLLIPSINAGRYIAVHRRDLRPDIPSDERWKDAPGGTKSELYLADCLKRKTPTILCEDALSALSVAQEAGDLVNVVATCGADCGQQVKWLARLARQPMVLVALDADPSGDENSKWWLDRLSNGRRMRPLLKDINDMLMQGWDVRQWIQDALQEVESFECCTCGLDLNNVDRDAYIGETGLAYCSECWEIAHAHKSVDPQPFTSHDQFMSTAEKIAQVFGPGCKITPVSKDYTLKQHVAHLQEKERQVERNMWAKARTKKARAHTMEWTRAQVRTRDPDAERAATHFT